MAQGNLTPPKESSVAAHTRIRLRPASSASLSNEALNGSIVADPKRGGFQKSSNGNKFSSHFFANGRFPGNQRNKLSSYCHRKVPGTCTCDLLADLRLEFDAHVFAGVHKLRYGGCQRDDHLCS